MMILDCVSSTISLADTAFFDFGPSLVHYYSTYSESADDAEFTEYASAQHEQTEVVEECGPAITSFTPTTVAGGIQEILEIHGTGFGSTRVTGTVFFKNANDGGVSEVACDSADFLLAGWSDDLIRSYVPSADTAIISGIAVPNSPAGTGSFQIVTNEGLSIPSVDELTIPYSVASNAQVVPKRPAYLAPRSVFEERFVFHIDSLVARYQDGAMIPVIKKALREWTCLTGIDRVVAEDTVYSTLPGAQADSICIINFGGLGSGSEYVQLALTTCYGATCDQSFYTVESDVTLNNDPDIVWFIDTVVTNSIPAGQHDLYHILLHELGHAHNLKHVIAPEHIMYFADNTYEGFRKIELFSDASAYAGGNWVMDASYLDPPTTESCDLTPISITTAPFCTGFYSIGEQPDPGSILLQPNPFTGSVSLVCSERRIRAVEVFNVLGASVFRSTQQPSTVALIDLSTIGRGVYMINALLDDNTSLTVKAVKGDRNGAIPDHPKPQPCPLCIGLARWMFLESRCVFALNTGSIHYFGHHLQGVWGGRGTVRCSVFPT